jgi:hypothetical protein
MAETNGEHSNDPGDRGARRRGGRLSDILTSIAGDESRDRVSVADIFQAMGDRAFGALILIFALPNIIPTPPGTSALTGAPLVFLSAQLMLGQSPWLPKIIAERSMTRGDFASIVSRISPWLARGERMLRPRLGFLIYPPAEYIIGLLCLILSTVLILPVPLGNILRPLRYACSPSALERDGLCVVLGAAMTVVSLTVVAGVLFALVKGFILLLTTTIF